MVIPAGNGLTEVILIVYHNSAHTSDASASGYNCNAREEGMDDLYQRFVGYIQEHRLVGAGDTVLLSLSAGKDSMAMLDLFLRYRDLCPLDLRGFHLNHLMRGDESNEDEAFVKERLKEHGIPFLCERFDFSSGTPAGLSFEDYARRVRYEKLAGYAAETGAVKIATAHNSDDNVETVLMRIGLGTGIGGLGGIRAARDNIIRPLLEFSSREIYGYLEFRGLEWREDATNRDTVYLRNYVRNALVPGMEERFPRLRDSVHSLSRVAEDTVYLIDDLIVAHYGDMWTREGDGRIILDAERYLRDRRLLFYMLNRAFAELGVFSGNSILHEIWKRANTGRTHEVLYEGRDVSARKTLRGPVPVIIVEKEALPAITDDWEYRITPDRGDIFLVIPETGLRIRVFYADYDIFQKHYRDNGFIFVDAGDNVDYIILRNRRRGDRITLGGTPRRIKKLLIDIKLGPQDKERAPVLVMNGEIAAFMPGFITNSGNRTGDRFKVTGPGKKILAIEAIGK